MKLFLTQNLSEDLVNKIDVIRARSEILEEYFKNKDYGTGIKELYFCIVCVNPEFDFFYKDPRKKYSKVKKIVEYDVKIKHAQFISEDEFESKQALIDGLVQAVEKLHELSIGNFDFNTFATDFKNFIASKF